MRGNIVKLFLILLFLISATTVSLAQDNRFSFRYFSDYIYISDQEVTEFNEIIWFWNADTLDGSVHTNSMFGIKLSPTFNGPVTTSADEYYQYAAAPTLTYPIVLGWPEAAFPENLNPLIGEAELQGTAFENENGAYQFRCIGDTTGWNWYKWAIEQEFDPDIVVDQGSIPYGNDLAVYFNGSVEIASNAVSGTGSIGCIDTLKIINDLKYVDVTLEDITIPEDSENKYGYLCDGDIMIMNTLANGRGNGGYQSGQHAAAHVVITGSLFAVDEMLTFENQNDEHDDWVYCRDVMVGSPDERGTIYLRGSLANKRRGYIHRSNCGGTGYSKSYKYDYRLLESPPPFFPQIEWDEPIIVDSTSFENIDIELGSDDAIVVAGQGNVSLGNNCNITKNYAASGRKYLFKSYYGGSLSFDADIEEPTTIEINNPTLDVVELMRTDGVNDWGVGSLADDQWTGLNISGVRYSLPAHDNINNCSFSGSEIEFIALQGNAATSRTITNSTFSGDFDFASEQSVFQGYHLISNSIFYGDIAGRVENIDRCNFFPLEGIRPSINTDGGVTNISNSFFKSHYQTILLSENIFMDYCGYNTMGTTPPFSPVATIGNHMQIEVDPMFVDYENGDYHLLEGSPLIDAGDPASTPDPDGTIADIGAFYYYQDAVEPNSNTLPNKFNISKVWPNPFNSSTKIKFELNRNSDVRFIVYDLMGRQVKSYFLENVAAGYHESSIDLSHQSSGIYFLTVNTDEQTIVRKLYYIK